MRLIKPLHYLRNALETWLMWVLLKQSIFGPVVPSVQCFQRRPFCSTNMLVWQESKSDNLICMLFKYPLSLFLLHMDVCFLLWSRPKRKSVQLSLCFARCQLLAIQVPPSWPGYTSRPTVQAECFQIVDLSCIPFTISNCRATLTSHW